MPLVRGCLWGLAKRLACRAVDHFRLYDHRFYALFRVRAMGELLLSNLEYKSFSDFLPIYSGRGQDISPAGLTGSAGCNRYGRRGGDHGLCSVLVPDLSDWVASLAVIVLLLTLNSPP